MEVVGGDEDFGLALGDALDGRAPFASGLEGGLDGFGAGVHGERHLVAGELMEIAEEQGELIVAEGARGEGYFLGLAHIASKIAGWQWP